MILKMKTKSKRKNKTVYVLYALLSIIISVLLSFVYSCEKKEPAVKLEPGEIMRKIADVFPEYNKDADFDSSIKSKELSEKKATELYSDAQNKPVDMSKIEKYSITQFTEDSADEIAIFKLYDKINAEYVKEMAQARILKMQDYGNSVADINISMSGIFNNAEIRVYGEYVYYVSHPRKDKIFEIIENSLRGT